MHVLITAKYELACIVQPGVNCTDWIISTEFENIIHNIPGLESVSVSLETSSEDVLIHRKEVVVPATKVSVKVCLDEDIPGRHDVNLLRLRMHKAFMPMIETLRQKDGCLDAYMCYPDIRIIEVVKDHPENILEFSDKSGRFHVPSGEAGSANGKETQSEQCNRPNRSMLAKLFSRK